MRPERGGREAAMVFAAAACVLALLFYREFVFHPGMILYGDDMLNEGYALRNFGVGELKAGRGFPLWNPFVYGGQPYLATLPGPVFYPTSLLYLLMPLGRAIGWTFVLHTALAGVLGWWACRSLELDRGAAAVGGLAFMFSGFVLSPLYGGHDGRMFAMVLIPAGFAFLERGLRSGRAAWFAGLGLVVALQTFTPHIQIMYFSSLALTLYAALRIAGLAREERSIRPALRLGGLWALAFAIAALVGAAQLIPTAHILDVAVRGGAGESGYAFASSWALPPQELTALVLPDLIGSLRTYWGANPFKLHTEYLGVVPVALALLGMSSARRDARVRSVTAVAALGLLFALGSATPVHRIAYALVPFIGRFRAPSLMLGPVALMVALLAACGWQRVLDARNAKERLPWTGVLLAAVPLGLLGVAAALGPEGLLRWIRTSWYPEGWSRPVPAPLVGELRTGGWLLLAGLAATFGIARAVAVGRLRSVAVVALLALLVGDLWRIDARYLSTVRPEEYFRSDAVIDHLQASLAPGERAFPLPEPGGYRPNELMVHEIPTVTGSQKFRLEWYERLTGGLSYQNLGNPALWPLLDLRYLTSGRSLQVEFLTPEASGPRGTAYRVEGALGHAWFPTRVEATLDTAAALRRLLTAGDVRQLAVVEAREAPPAGEGRADILSYRPNEVVLRASAERTGLLFVSEVFYPAWRATVDGNPARIYRTNVAFRGVVVPEGTHEVRFVYSAREFRLGFLLSGGGVVLAFVVLGLSGTRGHRRREESESGVGRG